jgi:surface polysaccharide O-acyltransferase-like enzyme
MLTRTLRAASSPQAIPMEARDTAIDLVKVVALVLVVIVHVVGSPVVMFGQMPSGSWWYVNVLDSAARSCVPLFLLASGALILDARRLSSLPDFFRRRLSKVVLPLIPWTLFYFWYRHYLYEPNPLTLPALAGGFWTGTLFYHLPFLYWLVGLYLAAPFLVKMADPKPGRDFIIYLAAFWFGSLLLAQFTYLAAMPTELRLVVATGLVGFYLFGRLLRDVRIDARLTALCTIGVVLLTAFVAVMTYVFSLRAKRFEFYWYDYQTPAVAGMAILTYLILLSEPARSTLQRRPALSRALAWLSDRAFGIYLVNPLAISLLIIYRLNYSRWGDGIGFLIGIPMDVVLSLLFSIAIVQLLRTTPLTRWMVP